jgi:quercetin 2,3-dioxygenase
VSPATTWYAVLGEERSLHAISPLGTRAGPAPSIRVGHNRTGKERLERRATDTGRYGPRTLTMREPTRPRTAAEANNDEDQRALVVTQSRSVDMAGFPVRRALPQRGRRTVGAWCFADHLGPMDSDERGGLDVGPHPHMGLQTVTWLVEGEVLHRDSLGSEQLIRPGQLNLMTAGNGIAHAEESTGHYQGRLHGIQLWIAQPEATRHTAPAFEHFDELPDYDLGSATATVLTGSIGGIRSSARRDSEVIGIELSLRKNTTVPLREDFEYALVVLEGTIRIGERSLSAGQLGYLRSGRDEVAIDVADVSRTMLLGGKPFDEQILMWWNFVARTHEEVDAAYRSWELDDGRFGSVASSLERITTRRPIGNSPVRDESDPPIATVRRRNAVPSREDHRGAATLSGTKSRRRGGEVPGTATEGPFGA